YQQAYYQTVADLLRRDKMHLDRDILASELHEALARGEGVSLTRHAEQLYRFDLLPGAPVIDREVRSLGLADMQVLIVGLIRDESEIVPHGGTRLQPHDRLLVAAGSDAIEHFRALITPGTAIQMDVSPTELN